MRKRYRPTGLLLFVAALLVNHTAAEAAVISAMPDQVLTASPFLISFGGGAAGYAFTADNTGAGPGAAVATSGVGLVSNFFGLTDFSAGSTIDATGLYNFIAFPIATYIPNSVADDFIGLAFNLSDGTHYGYAEISGAELVSYGYDSTAGTTILTGEAAVPEPAALPVLATALIMLFAVSRGGLAVRGLLDPFRQIRRISRNT